MTENLFRSIPSVDELLKAIQDEPGVQSIPRTLLKDLVNTFLDQCRSDIRSGRIDVSSDLNVSSLVPRLLHHVRQKSRPNFRRVINATGVVVHTNLGRSLMAEPAVQAVDQACRWYSNLEFSLETGKRGSRYALVEDLLCRLTGAEAGLVVNNNAAAVLLMLDTLAAGKEVVVSRGQLVEIGGSFRIPDVMAKSGAVLKEVGATNRTHLYDYEQAIGENTGALLKAHTSNYRIIGFHKEVPLPELVKLGERYNLPVLEDLGSGNLFSFPSQTGLDEPTVQSVLKTGVSVVTFSGDKLLGGPQAGIILGRKEYIQPIKKNPLNRALRIDKMTLAGLEATLRLYLDPENAEKQVPTLSMICASPEQLKRKARRLASGLRSNLSHAFEVRTVSGASRVGGGASPEHDLPTTLIQLVPKKGIAVEALRDVLLQTDPPLVGRVEHDSLCLDPRTLQADELRQVGPVLEQALELLGRNQ
ncbi:L-seryl-tRNA(Sec) selenium transferase [Desulfovermiculus halophilus]|uniref:L-seryl-tRNA(Sec) selenium transferase n=1 Tax=Desulfovermiculus halophilus TaxID=339722 RepID=UPI000486A22F|nr:L-seryl-tRNA(Sec) selenium transferase [Desulfovermiculus halophilus]